MRYLSVLFIMVGLIGCTKSAVPDWETIPDPEPYYSTEGDVDFITEILSQHYGNAMTADIPLVIEQEISGISQLQEKDQGKWKKYLFQDAKKEGEKVIEAFVAYLAKNRKQETIEELGTLPFNHVILTKAEKQRYFDLGHKAGWDKFFYEAYPDSPGILNFSRPGFSKDGTVAVIDLGKHSAPLGGSWGTYIYEKKEGKWKRRGTIGGVLVS